MSGERQDFSRRGFAKTFVFPALSVFLIPALTLAFFLYAQSSYDRNVREHVIEQLQADDSLSHSDRVDAIDFFSQAKMSNLVRDDEFAAQTDRTLVFRYLVFRWMIWSSIACLAASVGMLLIGSVCVVFSRGSQRALYRSLAVGWQVMRVFGAFQAITQVTMLVMLSFWVTALLTNTYIVQLISFVALFGFIAVASLVHAIFARIPSQLELPGEVITFSSLKDSQHAALWAELREICNRVGTAAPAQVILGVDDNFFVTEQAVTVGSQQLEGRTLYVSLSLLKQLHGAEAEAVLAHEMAHFSGQDTTFSKKTAPLLALFDTSLAALYESTFTRPIFYFMMCFRVLFELSLGRMRRSREFRADRIAAESTSAIDLSTALLRTIAYSTYRDSVQQKLFNQELALEAADIATQIEQGFPEFLASFVHDGRIATEQIAHPFDSHPPTIERLKALDVDIQAEATQRQLKSVGDGRWFCLVSNAESIEREQWAEFEDQFQQFHRSVLAYRYLPDADNEIAVVSEAFPLLEFEGKKGILSIDYQQIKYDAWAHAVGFHEITSMVMLDNILVIGLNRDGQANEQLNANHVPWKEVHEAIGRYYERYQYAKSYCDSATTEMMTSRQ